MPHPPPLPPGWQMLHRHPGAPAKPEENAPCNGCGLCCLAEPCPLGMLVSRKRQGACDALRWSESGQRYLCGLLAEPASVLPSLPRWAVRGAQALTQRSIGVGSGCDCALQVQADAPPDQ